MGKTVNVMDYIPAGLRPGIAAMTSTDDVSSYLNAAHYDASNFGVGGGEVQYEAGRFNASNVLTYDDQHVFGAYRATEMHQIGSADIFVPWAWANNDTTAGRTGAILEKFLFTTPDANAGGYAIIKYDERSHLNCIESEGLPVLLTAKTANGSLNAKGQTAGHSITDPYFHNCPRGAIASDGTTVTDVKLIGGIYASCGKNGGAPTVGATTFAGWQIDRPKMYYNAGAVFRGSVWNTLIQGADIDWNGTDTAALDFTLTGAENQGLRLLNNNFRTTNDVFSSAAAILVKISGSSAVPVHLTHVGNTYWNDPSILPNAQPLSIFDDGVATGISLANRYLGFTGYSEASLGFLAP